MTYEEFVETLQDWRDTQHNGTFQDWRDDRAASIREMLHDEHVAMLAYVDSLRAELAELHRIPMPKDIEVNQ